MKNFPFQYEGQTYWWSRSVAVASFVFASDSYGDIYVLANKRGEGCPDFNGYWNCPCGYLDCNETTRQAAVRECFEETGLQFDERNMYLDGVDDSPTSNHQNITFRFWTVADNCVETLMEQFSKKNMEKNEVADMKFIKLSDINKYQWAFNHDKDIMRIFNENFIEED